MKFTKKKIIILTAVISVLIILAILVITLCSLYVPRRLIKMLPEEEIISVTRVTVTQGGEETQAMLPEDKIIEFYGYLKDFKYVKNYNVGGVKGKEWDSVRYVITYESCTVHISEHSLNLLSKDEYIKFYNTSPKNIFNEFDKLFEG